MSPAGEHAMVQRSGTDELPLILIDTDELTAIFAPTRGGRLLSLRRADEEFLWHNRDLLDDDFAPRTTVADWPTGRGGMGSWANVGGSKTWPAPQGWDGPAQWPGPPDLVLDSGAWTVEVEQLPDRVIIRMVSPDDPRSGLRIIRSFGFRRGSSHFSQAITLENIADHAVRWSPWEVCQVDTSGGGLITFEGAAAGELRDLGRYEGDAVERVSGTDVSFEAGRGVTKHGCVGGSGAVFYTRPGGSIIRLALAPIAGSPGAVAEYPDGGCRTEIWLQRPTSGPIDSLGGLHPDAQLAELEVLGPLVTLQPSESSTVTIDWSLSGPS